MAATLTEFEKALNALGEALNYHQEVKGDSPKKIARDACIQRFEFCIEIAWKTAAKIIGTNSTAPNLVIRELARNDILENPEAWLHYIKARNMTSHTYDEKIAKIVFETVLSFYPEAQKLLAILKTK